MFPTIIIDMARVEEYAGDVAAARGVMARAREVAGYEWKVFLESVLIEIRARDLLAALSLVQQALQKHPGTGRLWAIYMQLMPKSEHRTQLAQFHNAFRLVPKSGEVWCEGGRIFMQYGDYSTAERALKFATQFTPQYGDSFVELVHLLLLRQQMLRRNPHQHQHTTPTFNFNEEFALLAHLCATAEPNYGPFWLFCKKSPMDSPKQVLRNALQVLSPLVDAQGGVEGQAVHAVVDINEMYVIPKGALASERRKLIFGSDQLKP
eukprot:TRINITY_DN1358_c1_g1_i1.p1 TRINITY_DN1358_c1_g1~~TRINITY_DN1358_c1_g1_i1.p1  ORF type:complete len:293 (+),score=79.29 TRINITY_DN1358_c1_g1_i1:88-879(+)